MPSPIKLDDTLGAAFLGNIFAAIFYGITSVQTFSYYKHNGKDSRILDGLHLALITDTIYTYTVKDFTDLLAISVPTRSIVVHIVVEGISSLIIRSFFCYRIWRLGQRSWAVVIAIVVLSLIEFGWHKYRSKQSSYSQLTKSVDPVPELLRCPRGRRHRRRLAVLAASKTSHRLQKNRFYHTSPDAVQHQQHRPHDVYPPLSVTSVHELTAHPASLSSAASLPSPIPQFITMPDNLIFIGFYFVLPKLYLNSFLVTLNSRKHVREIGSSAPVMSIPLSAMSGTHTAATSTDGGGGKSQYEDQVLQIQIQTTTDMKSDSATPIV
ncbi:hypothetical protein A0H81_03502 [Grifola frondosa]|uniref:DUF6534 domain-containing protein n=1 Tax=Grifola frondosa TaxID=5627 RepID=A0A1C7MGI5_GRIFR|nr:hypothetical protein A0H81_03502 [Grifola frondosa]